jgi:hypothetical protein
MLKTSEEALLFGKRGLVIGAKYKLHISPSEGHSYQ